MTQMSPEEQDRFDREAEIANEAFFALMDDMGEVAHRDDLDPMSMMYALWISIGHYLFECGWNSAELSKDIIDHERLHHGQNKPS